MSKLQLKASGLSYCEAVALAKLYSYASSEKTYEVVECTYVEESNVQEVEKQLDSPLSPKPAPHVRDGEKNSSMARNM
jgi:hypothetical protein